jgi:hypothetical protein
MLSCDDFVVGQDEPADGVPVLDMGFGEHPYENTLRQQQLQAREKDEKR